MSNERKRTIGLFAEAFDFANGVEADAAATESAPLLGAFGPLFARRPDGGVVTVSAGPDGVYPDDADDDYDPTEYLDAAVYVTFVDERADARLPGSVRNYYRAADSSVVALVLADLALAASNESELVESLGFTDAEAEYEATRPKSLNDYPNLARVIGDVYGPPLRPFDVASYSGLGAADSAASRLYDDDADDARAAIIARRFDAPEALAFYDRFLIPSVPKALVGVLRSLE